jgi:NNP family nitrate/nitrite transporter-like MFS transporter
MRRYLELKGEALVFLFLLWSLWFFNFSGRVIFSPVLPLIEDEFMVSHARASSIFIFQSIGYAAAIILSAFYSGRVGFKRTILFSFAILACVCFCVPFVKAFSAFYLILFFVGFSGGIYLPAMMPLIREHFAEGVWGKTISIYDSAGAISIFSVPFLVLLLLNYFHWRGIFGILGIALLVVALIFSLKGEELKINQPRKTVFKGLITKKSFWVMVTIMSVAMGANMGIYSILPLYLTKELFLSIGYANALLGISRLGGVGVAVLCGFLVDRFNLRKIMFIMMIVSGVLTILMGMASSALIGIILFFQAVFISAMPPLMWVCLVRLFDRETVSMAIGFIAPVSFLFGTGLIPYLLGLSGDLLGFGFGIIIIGVLLALISCLAISMRDFERT